MRVAFVLRSIEVYLLVFRFVSPFYQSSSSHSCVHVHIHDLYSPPTFIQYKSTFIKKYTPILTLTQHNTFLLLLFFFGVKCVTLHFFQGRLFWCEVRHLAFFSSGGALQFFLVRSSCNFFWSGPLAIFFKRGNHAFFQVIQHRTTHHAFLYLTRIFGLTLLSSTTLPCTITTLPLFYFFCFH